jgi:hypothetical protein
MPRFPIRRLRRPPRIGLFRSVSVIGGKVVDAAPGIEYKTFVKAHTPAEAVKVSFSKVVTPDPAAAVLLDYKTYARAVDLPQVFLGSRFKTVQADRKPPQVEKVEAFTFPENLLGTRARAAYQQLQPPNVQHVESSSQFAGNKAVLSGFA